MAQKKATALIYGAEVCSGMAHKEYLLRLSGAGTLVYQGAGFAALQATVQTGGGGIDRGRLTCAGQGVLVRIQTRYPVTGVPGCAGAGGSPSNF